jgi:hypothetical protein
MSPTGASSIVPTPATTRRLVTVGNEDWWAVVVGLSAVILGLIDLSLGGGIVKYLAVSPSGMKWVVQPISSRISLDCGRTTWRSSSFLPACSAVQCG